MVRGLLQRRRSRYRHRFTDLTDSLIPIYSSGFQRLGGRRHEAFRRRTIKLAGLQAGLRVVDAGCGTGLTALRMASLYPGCVVHGVDISARMIDAACQDAQKKGLDVAFSVGTLTALPYRRASFDVVLTNIVFHHLDLGEKRRAVFEIARLLKPGGRYISAEFGPRARNALERHLAKGDYTLYPSHIKAAGLTITHEELSPFPWGLQVFHRVAIKPLSDHGTKDHPG